jgi:hypothetical protein
MYKVDYKSEQDVHFAFPINNISYLLDMARRRQSTQLEPIFKIAYSQITVLVIGNLQLQIILCLI